MLLFSVVNEFVEMLGINHPNILFTFNNDKNGNHRKSPVVIKTSSYNKAISVFGKTRNIPYGALGKKQKEELGNIILALLS